MYAGIHYFDAQQYEKAISSFRQAVKLDPTYRDPRYHLGVTYRALRMYDQALEQLKAALGNADDQSYGQLVWSFRAGWTIFAKPATDSTNVYIGMENKFLYAVDKKDGTLKWSQQLSGCTTSAAFISGSRIYVAAERRVYALNTEDGKVFWEFETDGEVKADLAGNEQMLFVAANSDDEAPAPSGRICALDLVSGVLRWQFNVGQPAGVPTIVNSRVVFGAKDGSVYALNSSSGKPGWTAKVDGSVQYAAAPADGVLFLAAGQRLHAIDDATGEICGRWNSHSPLRARRWWTVRESMWPSARRSPASPSIVQEAKSCGNIRHPPESAHSASQTGSCT